MHTEPRRPRAHPLCRVGTPPRRHGRYGWVQLYSRSSWQSRSPVALKPTMRPRGIVFYALCGYLALTLTCVNVPRPTTSALEPLNSLATAPDDSCLSALQKLGVQAQNVAPVAGVEFPVRIAGRLGGVQYFTWDDRPLILDCALAHALVRVGPSLTTARSSVGSSSTRSWQQGEWAVYSSHY